MRVLVDVTFEVEAASEAAAEILVQQALDMTTLPSAIKTYQVFEPYRLEEVSA